MKKLLFVSILLISSGSSFASQSGAKAPTTKQADAKVLSEEAEIINTAFRNGSLMLMIKSERDGTSFINLGLSMPQTIAIAQAIHNPFISKKIIFVQIGDQKSVVLNPQLQAILDPTRYAARATDTSCTCNIQ